jgi:hypothetical protein
VRRYFDVAVPGVGFRCGDLESLVDADYGALDSDYTVGLGRFFCDDVAAAQLGQLAEPQRTPSREQNHRAVRLGHLLGDDRYFVK